MNTVEKISEEGLAAASLSPLPKTTLEIIRVISDPCFEFGELIRPISTDPDLTAKLLRLANSPLYGRSHPASTIGDAVVRLGSGMVQGLALACAAKPGMKYNLTGFGSTLGEFWTHCIACVTAAEEIQRTGIVRFGSGFATAALLHDYGKLLLSSVMTTDQHKELLRLRRSSLDKSHVECEREVLGVDHAFAGAIVARQWNLPTEIVNAIQGHHSEVDWSQNLTNGVIIANQLAQERYSSEFSHSDSENVAEAMLALGLTDLAYNEILQSNCSKADALSSVI